MFMMILAAFVLMVMMIVAVFVLMKVVAVLVRMTVVALMVVVMASFFLTVYRYSHMRSRNAAFYRLLFLELYAGYAERIEFLYKFIGLRQQLQQCCCQHIAGRAHSAV